MTDLFPSSQAPGIVLEASHDNSDCRALLALRRSTPKQCLVDPGPSPAIVDELLRIAARVPDHRRVEPWRFIVFEDEARLKFGQRLAEIHSQNTILSRKKELENERMRFLRAPVVIAVISSPDPAHKTPVWEQELSVGAVCMTLLLAANAAGWAGTWLTEWLAYDTDVARLLGLAKAERVAGFIYLGTAKANPPERPRPEMGSKIMRWTG